MPIRADLRHLYRGAAWRELRERILVVRASDRCEQCGKPNRTAVLTHTGVTLFGEVRMCWALSGVTPEEWTDQQGNPIRVLPAGVVGPGVWIVSKPPRVIRVKIGVAHLDHDPSNNADDNLKALCDWCHLHYDQLHHRETRATRKDAARPMQWEGGIAV